MAFTTTTIENLTVVSFTSTTVATTLYTPSPAEIGRFRLRVVRAVFQGATGGDSITVTGITPTSSGTETQTLAILVCPLSAAAAAVVVAAVDQISFPDEAEFRGKIQIANTLTSGAATLFLHHG